MSGQSTYDGHLGHTVKRLYHLMGQYFNDVLRPYGVAHSQWYVLYALSQSPQLTQKELQAAMQVESATLTVTIDGLVRKGWIERRQSISDGRVKELHFTPAGRELWERLPDPIAAIRAKMLEGIEMKDEQFVQYILNKAIENFEQS
jgi:DNA-binding MarR family transcriptional regulator